MNKIEFGDNREVMKRWADQGVKVQMCVTSPPYYGLRSYLPDGNTDKEFELGDEQTPEEFIENLVDVFRGVRDILADDGVIWVNMGDSYYNYRPGKGQRQSKQSIASQKYSEVEESAKRGRVLEGYKEKDLMGIPWMLAFALRKDGWYLRQDIIWCLSGGTMVYVKSQKGIMPMSIKDMVRLDPSTVQLWNGTKWTNVLGWGESNDTSQKLELVLRSGERIGCTGGHLWPTMNGNVKASELKVGDVIDSCVLPEPNHPVAASFLTNELLWLIGLYLAEGSRSEDTLQLSLNADEISWLPKIETAVNHVGGTITHTIDGDNLSVRIYGKVINAVIDDYIGGKTAKDKHLTNKVWMMPNEALKSIIIGYFDGDGHCDTENNRIRLGFCRNYYLEQNLRTVAARMGASLTLNLSSVELNGKVFPTFQGEWRWEQSEHHNVKYRSEIVEIRGSRGRKFWDISVDDEPHLFSLASGVLTHNCKPNPMPESVRDRCTKSHEYIFLLSKSEKYFYDNEAIKEPVAASTDSRLSQPTLDEQTGSERVPVKTNGNMKAVGDLDKRNKRSVWTVTTKPFKGAHFATYPPELIEPCVLAGTSARGHCPECGSRWQRVVERTVGESVDCPKTQAAHEARGGVGSPTGTVGKSGGGRIDAVTTTLGWEPTCECGHEPVPDIVFDPFMGSGTTAGVALKHGRQYMGCELNLDYKDLQTDRIKQVSENKGLEVVDNGDNVVVVDNNLFIIE